MKPERYEEIKAANAASPAELVTELLEQVEQQAVRISELQGLIDRILSRGIESEMQPSQLVEIEGVPV